MRNFFFFFFLSIVSTPSLFAQRNNSSSGQREFIVLRIYHATDSAQLTVIDQYLQASLRPALEKSGFTRTGFFNAVNNDTAADKRMYAVVPLPSLAQFESFTATAARTLTDSTASPGYTKALYNVPPYARMETILLQAFEGSPQVKKPSLKGNVSERVYELRSYESATEALHLNKVQMFNTGEVSLFQRLGFNAVFYGQVMAGSRMPNLMYLTSFENKAVRDEHWKTFGADPEWKAMSGKPEYQHNVSSNIITFLRPTAYSKL